MQAQRRQCLAVLGKQLIGSNLLKNEVVEGHVLVQRIDHPVPIPPGMGSRVVVLESITVGIADDVQPVLGPALSIGRRGQQSIHQPRPCARTTVRHETVNLFRGRWQAKQVQVQPANQDLTRCR